MPDLESLRRRLQEALSTPITEQELLEARERLAARPSPERDQAFVMVTFPLGAEEPPTGDLDDDDEDGPPCATCKHPTDRNDPMLTCLDCREEGGCCPYCGAPGGWFGGSCEHLVVSLSEGEIRRAPFSEAALGLPDELEAESEELSDAELEGAFGDLAPLLQAWEVGLCYLPNATALVDGMVERISAPTAMYIFDTGGSLCLEYFSDSPEQARAELKEVAARLRAGFERLAILSKEEPPSEGGDRSENTRWHSNP